MKKLSKIIPVLMLITILLISVSNIVFAATGAIDPATVTAQEANTDKITNMGGQIITIISVVGSVAAVIVLVVIGLKYMMGSAEEKAEYKKTLMPYVIGAVLVFAASAIAGMVFQFANGMNK